METLVDASTGDQVLWVETVAMGVFLDQIGGNGVTVPDDDAIVV